MIKKGHTLKLLCFTNPSKRILYLSEAYHGSCHDFKILKEEFNTNKENWFSKIEIFVDLGFLGIQKHFSKAVKIPFKRSKNKKLTEKQKRYNKSVSQIRIKVEHSIGGMKRYRILSDRLRMKSMVRYNQIAGICAGLWNFNLTS